MDLKALKNGEKVTSNFSNKIQMMVDFEIDKMTEGEKNVEWFLEKHEMDYLFEVEIYGLVGDSKGFRRADFYLPRYDVFIEFNGEYNSTKEKRKAYDHKSLVYENNDIPVIELYPDNLGNLEYTFFDRLDWVLNRPDRKKYYLRYKRDSFIRENALVLIVLMSIIFFWGAYIMPDVLIFFLLSYTFFGLLWTLGMLHNLYLLVKKHFS